MTASDLCLRPVSLTAAGKGTREGKPKAGSQETQGGGLAAKVQATDAGVWAQRRFWRHLRAGEMPPVAESQPRSPGSPALEGSSLDPFDSHAPCNPILRGRRTGQPTLGKVSRQGTGLARGRLASATCFLSLQALSLAQRWPPAFRPSRGPSFPWASPPVSGINNSSQRCGRRGAPSRGGGAGSQLCSLRPLHLPEPLVLLLE